MDHSSEDLNKSPIPQNNREIQNQTTKLIQPNLEALEDDLRKVSPVLIGHSSDVIGLALTRNNLHLISCGKDNTVRIWSIASRIEEEKFQLNLDSTETLTGMVLSNDEKLLVFSVNFRFFLVWDLERKLEIVRRFCDGEGFIRAIDISYDNSKIALVDSEQDVKIFDINGNLIQSIKHSEAPAFLIHFTQNSIIIIDSSSQLYSYSIQSFTPNYSFSLLPATPVSSFLFKDMVSLAISFDDGNLAIFNLTEKLQKSIIKVNNGIITKIVHSAESNSLVCVLDQYKVVFIDQSDSSLHPITRCNCTINSIVQTPDGKLLVVGSSDSQIKFCHSDDYLKYQIPKLFGTSILSSSVNNTSDHLALAFSDGTVKLFDLKAENEIYKLTWDGQIIYTAIWSPDKTQIITSNGKNEIRVYNYTSKQIEFCIPCETSIYNLTISSDSNLLFGSNGENEVFIWNYRQKRLETVLDAQCRQYSIWICETRNRLYAGTDSGIIVWDLEKREIRDRIQGHSAVVTCLVGFGRRGLISGGNDGKIFFWDLDDNGVLGVVDEESERSGTWARSFELFNNQKLLAVIHDNSIISIINTETYKIEQSFSLPGSHFSLKVYQDKTLIVGDTTSIRFIDLQTLNEESPIICHTECIFALLIDKDSNSLLSFSFDRTIQCFDLALKSELKSLQIHCYPIKSLLPSANFLLIGTENGCLHIYDSKSPSHIKSIKLHSDSIQSIDLHSNLLACGSNDRKVSILNTINWEIFYLEGHSDNVREVKFSNDGKFLFTCGDDSCIKVWNLQSRIVEYELQGHVGAVYRLCIFKTKNYIASGSSDRTVKIWDLDRRIALSSVEVHSGSVISLVLEEDEGRIFTGSDDCTVSVVDLGLGKKVWMLEGNCDPVQHLAVYNGLLFSISSEGVRRWKIDRNYDGLELGNNEERE